MNFQTFDQRYLNNNKAKFGKLSLFKFYSFINPNKKFFIEFSQLVVKIIFTQSQRKIKTIIKNRSCTKFFSKFEIRYLDNHLTKFDKLFLFEIGRASCR